MFIENWLRSLDLISSLAPQIRRKPTLCHKTRVFVGTPQWPVLAGNSLFYHLEPANSGCWTLKASTFDVILAGIFAAILKRNHAIKDHFQVDISILIDKLVEFQTRFSVIPR